MQHIIEIRQKDLNDSKLTRLNQFIESGREEHTLLKKTQVSSVIDITNIPASITQLMEMSWKIVPNTVYGRYEINNGVHLTQVNLVVDEAGHRFVIIYTKVLNMPNTLGSIHIGYDAPLEAVNQMFAVSKIKADKWRYCI